MTDKRFLKASKVSEERYFRNDSELIRFIEKMEGMSWNAMCDTYSRLTEHNKETGRNYWEMHMNLNRDFLIMGKFIVRIFRGNFERTSGNYHINILMEQRADLLKHSDKKQLFNL